MIERLLVAFVAMLFTLAIYPAAAQEAPRSDLDYATLLPSASVPSYKAGVEYLMSLSEEDMLAIVPTQAGTYFTGCPNPDCHGGKQEHQLEWNPQNPRQARCTFCGKVFPSEKWPMTGIQKVTSPAGNVLEYPYYEDPTGYRFFFYGFMDYSAARYMSAAAFKMAFVYHQTGEIEYARRAVLILNRFAEVYPDYVYHFDFPFRQKEWYDGEVDPKDFRGGFRTARWHWWAYMDIPEDLIEAYDFIYNSGELDAIPGAKDRIENDFFIPATAQVIANNDTLHNMSPVAWCDMVISGRVLQRPEYVHTAVNRLIRFATERFYADGIWMEGAPSYNQQVIGGMAQVFAYTLGYSDPPGYSDPDTGQRFDNLDVKSDIPVLARIHSAYAAMRMPNGRLAPMHDTWVSTRSTPLTESHPVLLGGLGHAILGRGSMSSQMQTHLTWSGGYGHTHYDGLSMLLFAGGEEMLSDVGYTHTKYAPWKVSTVAHNTVVVDNENQIAGSNPPSDGSLLFFDAADEDMQVIRVENPQVYPNRVSRYERQLAMIASGPQAAYVVDCFTVSGGSRHDYFIHGSADRPQTLAITDSTGNALTMQPVSTMLPNGAKWEAPTGENFTARAADMGYAYGFLWDNQVSPAPAGFSLADFTYTGRDLFTRVWLLTDAAQQLYTGTNPQIRPAGEDDAKLDEYRRPYVMVRDEGEDLNSRFISVIEPVTSAQPAITSVRTLQTTGDGTAIAVSTADFTDVIGLYATDLRGQFDGVPFTMTGTLCRIRISAGEVTEAYTNGSLECLDLSLTLPPVQEAQLTAVERFDGRGAFIIDADWSQVGPPPGTVIILDHGNGYTHAYRVQSIERADTGSRIVLADEPGFEFDAETGTASFTFAQHWSFTGDHTIKWTPAAGYRRVDGE